MNESKTIFLIFSLINFRAKESMENAKRTYEMLNSELHDELPALYDSRVLFLVTNMQTLFAAEEVFHSETSKVTYLDIDLYISINIKYFESTSKKLF